MPNVDLNLEDFKGDTPLSLALCNAHFSCCEVLLCCGANAFLTRMGVFQLLEIMEGWVGNASHPNSMVTSCHILALWAYNLYEHGLFQVKLQLSFHFKIFLFRNKNQNRIPNYHFT
jgi:hypothetical protein